jgi:hypothetical protein
MPNRVYPKEYKSVPLEIKTQDGKQDYEVDGSRGAYVDKIKIIYDGTTYDAVLDVAKDHVHLKIDYANANMLIWVNMLAEPYPEFGGKQDDIEGVDLNNPLYYQLLDDFIDKVIHSINPRYGTPR